MPRLASSPVHLAFTDEQEELRTAIRSVLAKECPPTLPRSIAEGKGDADLLWAKMVELDWPALTVPEADGGIGYGYVELAVLVEELGRVLDPSPLFTTVTQYAPFLREAGAGELLGPVAAGGVTGTVAIAEAPTGWSLDGIQATLTADGDGFVLDGAKRHVLFPEADRVAVVARLGDELAVAVVDAADVSVDEKLWSVWTGRATSPSEEPKRRYTAPLFVLPAMSSPGMPMARSP